MLNVIGNVFGVFSVLMTMITIYMANLNPRPDFYIWFPISTGVCIAITAWITKNLWLKSLTPEQKITKKSWHSAIHLFDEDHIKQFSFVRRLTGFSVFVISAIACYAVLSMLAAWAALPLSKQSLTILVFFPLFYIFGLHIIVSVMLYLALAIYIPHLIGFKSFPWVTMTDTFTANSLEVIISLASICFAVYLTRYSTNVTFRLRDLKAKG